MALARAGPAPDAPCRPPQRTLSQMDPTLFWYVVATVLVLVGLAGVILPALPGLPLVFIGMLVAVVCLWFSHYVLDLRSALADNISSNIVGVALGTIVRYFGYKLLVFTGAKDSDTAPPATPPTASVTGAGGAPAA